MASKVIGMGDEDSLCGSRGRERHLASGSL